MMETTLRITVMVIGILFTVASLYLLVKKKNSEHSTILWLGSSLIAFILSIDPHILNTVATWVGVDYPPALLFLVSIMILLVIVLYQSIQISALNSKVKELGQAMALTHYQSPANLRETPVAAHHFEPQRVVE